MSTPECIFVHLGKHTANTTAGSKMMCILKYIITARDFPGGAVVKNPPANAGDMGSSPGPGRSHVPRSN